MNRLQLAKELARKAGAYIKENFHKEIQVSYKERMEMFTQVDLGSEKIILDAIKKEFPNDNILTEEAGSFMKNSEYTWIIDPLDGTHNYIHNIPIFSVSIGVWYKEKPFIGVVYFPITNEFFWAQKGKGAYMNDEKLIVKEETVDRPLYLADTTIIKRKEWRKTFLSFMDKGFMIRISGAATYNFLGVALSKATVGIEFHNKPGDFAASAIIVSEAGGIMTTSDGREITLNDRDIVASNKKYHQKILDMLKNKIE